MKPDLAALVAKELPWCNACDMRATGRWKWCSDPGGYGIKCDGRHLAQEKQG